MGFNNYIRLALLVAVSMSGCQSCKCTRHVSSDEDEPAKNGVLQAGQIALQENVKPPYRFSLAESVDLGGKSLHLRLAHAGVSTGASLQIEVHGTPRLGEKIPVRAFAVHSTAPTENNLQTESSAWATTTWLEMPDEPTSGILEFTELGARPLPVNARVTFRFSLQLANGDKLSGSARARVVGSEAAETASPH